jgi:hypothetical protein
VFFFKDWLTEEKLGEKEWGSLLYMIKLYAAGILKLTQDSKCKMCQQFYELVKQFIQ